MRELLTHIRGLPSDSAFVRGRRSEWSQQDELLAAVLDAARENTYYLLAVNGNKPEYPKPFPRPGVTAAEPEAVSLSGFASFLGKD